MSEKGYCSNGSYIHCNDSRYKLFLEVLHKLSGKGRVTPKLIFEEMEFDGLSVTEIESCIQMYQGAINQNSTQDGVDEKKGRENKKPLLPLPVEWARKQKRSTRKPIATNVTSKNNVTNIAQKRNGRKKKVVSKVREVRKKITKNARPPMKEIICGLMAKNVPKARKAVAKNRRPAMKGTTSGLMAPVAKAPVGMAPVSMEPVIENTICLDLTLGRSW